MPKPSTSVAQAQKLYALSASPIGAPTLVLLPIPEACARYGIARPTYYKRHIRGLLPPPVYLSTRCSRCPSDEVDATVLFLITQPTDVELKAFVKRLVKQRPENAQRAAT